MEQLIISDDQNTVTYGGITATFKPVNKVTKNTCRHCWFDRFPGVCSTNICSSSLRKDGREGVFTVQEMPVIKSKKK
jgi:hypothetical protein